MGQGFGAFGKIPSMGDFLRLDLPVSFLSPWDDWLQRSIVSVRDKLGQGWDAAYMSARIWRFTLPPQVVGPTAVSGIMMPSVDRVGRQYPLTLACAHATSATALVHFANCTVFEALEDIALAALEDDFSRDSLIAALKNVTLIEPAVESLSGTPYVTALPVAEIIAAEVISRRHGDSAFWSTCLGGDHRLMAIPGLPAGAELTALFDLSAPFWHPGGLAVSA
ncbi:type VI secretion system-associated protein TagF [Roseovarius sp. BRH_c41]|jgi:type VI secretion system protein ImpM|uniref:type VI secretion system-associated protein TagF n=1 Tax=Roseovarius sp. BRH_c41 TaxID=1629709 RepID=UPI0005F0EA31|nr:type VI secretion system-associated protein TagF [Roseovarius sp. BRH_c41]KJS40874.1 MAG: hypothetical protein VR71_20460 [Roseovarius sp. BRH_c41]